MAYQSVVVTVGHGKGSLHSATYRTVRGSVGLRSGRQVGGAPFSTSYPYTPPTTSFVPSDSFLGAVVL